MSKLNSNLQNTRFRLTTAVSLLLVAGLLLMRALQAPPAPAVEHTTTRPGIAVPNPPLEALSTREPIATDAKQKRPMRLRVARSDGTAVPNCEYAAIIEAKRTRGRTDASGIGVLASESFETVPAALVYAAYVDGAGSALWLCERCTPELNENEWLYSVRFPASSSINVKTLFGDGKPAPQSVITALVSSSFEFGSEAWSEFQDLVARPCKLTVTSSIDGVAEFSEFSPELLLAIGYKPPAGFAMRIETNMEQIHGGLSYRASPAGSYEVRVTLSRFPIIRATVRGTDGSPAENARIGFRYLSPSDPERMLQFSSASGKDGSAVLPVRLFGSEIPEDIEGTRCRITAWHPDAGWGRTDVRLSPDSCVAEVELRKLDNLVDLRGRVVDAVDLKPVEDIEVNLACSEFVGEVITTVRTDARGGFVFRVPRSLLDTAIDTGWSIQFFARFDAACIARSMLVDSRNADSGSLSLGITLSPDSAAEIWIRRP